MQQFLTENKEFTVMGIIRPSGVRKSTIMNELYGFDGSSPGELPTTLKLFICYELSYTLIVTYIMFSFGGYDFRVNFGIV